MPTYQYACTNCGHQLEAVQSFSDAPLTACPECDGRLRKVFSSVGIVFKGSGFYRTDSRSGSTSTDGAKSESAASSSTDTKSSTPSSGSDSSSTSTSSSASANSSSGASKPATTVAS